MDKKDFIPYKVEFYDKKGTLFKVMRVLRTGPVGKEILPTRFMMENLKKHHKTEISLDKIKLDQEIPDKEFTHRAIQR